MGSKVPAQWLAITGSIANLVGGLRFPNPFTLAEFM